MTYLFNFSMSYYKIIYDFYVNDTLISIPNSSKHNTTLIPIYDTETIDDCYSKTVEVALDIFKNYVNRFSKNNETVNITIEIINIEKEDIDVNKIPIIKTRDYFSTNNLTYR